VEVLRARLRKMLLEERYHLLHGRSWLRAATASEPLEDAWRQALEWFGPPDGEVTKLHGAGVLGMGPAELKARLEERLETRAPDLNLDWAHWDPRRRRSRPGQIDERTFTMLRGLEERKYAPADATGRAT
jgi:1,2-phenylacetyl-CoA epoxidase catalytic subunit